MCGARSWEGCSARSWGCRRARESGCIGGAAAPAQDRRRFPGSLGAVPPPPGKTKPPKGLREVAGNCGDERKMPTSSPPGWLKRPVQLQLCKVGWSMTKGASECRSGGAFWGLIDFHLSNNTRVCVVTVWAELRGYFLGFESNAEINSGRRKTLECSQ